MGENVLDGSRAHEGSGIAGIGNAVGAHYIGSTAGASSSAAGTRNPFRKTGVQLAKLVDTPPQGQEWLFELKYDGYRILAFIENNRARLVTRNDKDYTARFAAVASSLVELANGRAMVLDGEMVVPDNSGKTDFQALQNSMQDPSTQGLVYIIFDLLALDGQDLRELSLLHRKDTLQTLMGDAPQNLFCSKHIRGGGKDCLDAACRLGLEGIIGKKANSAYGGIRSDDWVKLKCDRRQEFVVGGFTLTDKKVSGISSLLLGYYSNEDGGGDSSTGGSHSDSFDSGDGGGGDGGPGGGDRDGASGDGDSGKSSTLTYAGRVGTGFGASNVERLLLKFQGLQRATSPFTHPPAPKKGETITWLEPKLVAEVRFSEWTKDNLLRQASYKGLRADKNPNEVQKEQTKLPKKTPEKQAKPGNNSIIIEGIEITKPQKVIFENPPITKVDVVRYYEGIAERMLPYVKHRILSVVRCPRGISEPCFFRKHPGPKGVGITTIPIPDSDGEIGDYYYIDSTPGLIFEAQMGTLEFHIWGSSTDELEAPDMMVFDLDPDEEMGLEKVRRGARDIKALLAELSLSSYLKTSGGKGYHVVVPLAPAASWNVFYDFAKRVAKVMEEKWPDRYTSNVRKVKRTDKIFIDWIRNGRGVTSIAPYSIRAREGARVSMPISWDELDTVAPDGVDMKNALQRAKGVDPWEGFFAIKQRLTVTPSAN